MVKKERQAIIMFLAQRDSGLPALTKVWWQTNVHGINRVKTAVDETLESRKGPRARHIAE